MGLWAFSNTFPHDFLTYAFFIVNSHLESWAWVDVSLLSRERNGTRPYNLKMKKTQWRYLAIMATVDPIGIIFLQTGLVLHAIRSRVPINHGHARDKSVLVVIIRPLCPTPNRSLLASTHYKLENWAHKHLSGDSIIDRLYPSDETSWNIRSNCFLFSSAIVLDLDLTDRSFAARRFRLHVFH